MRSFERFTGKRLWMRAAVATDRIINYSFPLRGSKIVLPGKTTGLVESPSLPLSNAIPAFGKRQTSPKESSGERGKRRKMSLAGLLVRARQFFDYFPQFFSPCERLGEVLPSCGCYVYLLKLRIAFIRVVGGDVGNALNLSVLHHGDV